MLNIEFAAGNQPSWSHFSPLAVALFTGEIDVDELPGCSPELAERLSEIMRAELGHERPGSYITPAHDAAFVELGTSIDREREFFDRRGINCLEFALSTYGESGDLVRGLARWNERLADVKAEVESDLPPGSLSAAANGQSTVADVRLAMMRGGFSPIPCRGKQPVMTKWQQHFETNEQEIRLWDRIYPYDENTGFLTRDTPTLDVDTPTGKRVWRYFTVSRSCSQNMAMCSFASATSQNLRFRSERTPLSRRFPRRSFRLPGKR
jgi:Bifunctional DNA primase/polymerase, N-terminal